MEELSMVYIKRFFELDSTRGSVKSAELLAFKAACTPEEWDGFILQAKAALGE
jgi:hypothetical protein